MANFSESDARRANHLHRFLENVPGPIKVVVISSAEVAAANLLISFGIPAFYSAATVLTAHFVGGTIGYVVMFYRK